MLSEIMGNFPTNIYRELTLQTFAHTVKLTNLFTQLIFAAGNSNNTWTVKVSTDNLFDIIANNTIAFQIASNGGWAFYPGGNFFAAVAFSSSVSIGGGLSTQYVGINTGSGFQQHLKIAASAAATSHINLVAGIAPTTPNNGDIWFDGTNIKMQIGGATKTFTLV